MTSTPNPELLVRYGTRDFYQRSLEKAAAPDFVRLLGPAASAAMFMHDSGHQEKLLREAAVLNMMMRRLEAERQAAVIGGLDGSAAALSPSGSAAQQLNQMKEYQKMMALMNKHGSVAPAASALADILEQQEMRKEAIGALMGAVGKGLVRGGNALRGGAGAAANKLKPGWKTKAGLGLAGAGTAYAGYKGLQTARDYMMQPTYVSTAWGGRNNMRRGVNEHGYANTPY